MKYLIVGTGGIGGYFGARLAVNGNDVTFVARGDHRAAMESTGLRLRSALGDLHIEQPNLHGEAGSDEPYDMVLVCTKLWDLADAADLVKPLLSPGTTVVPLQNGVSSEDEMAGRIGDAHVLGGVAHVASRIAEPGVIEHTGTLARLSFGERDGSASARVEALHKDCRDAGIDAKASTDINLDIWNKFLMLSPMAGATGHFRSPIGEILANEERRAFLEALVSETLAVAQAAGIALSADSVARAMERYTKLPPQMKTSLLHDLEAGRRLELPWLCGEVVRRATEQGLSTPANAEVVASLEPHIMGQA